MTNMSRASPTAAGMLGLSRGVEREGRSLDRRQYAGWRISEYPPTRDFLSIRRESCGILAGILCNVRFFRLPLHFFKSASDFRSLSVSFVIILTSIFRGFWSSFGSGASRQAPLGPEVGAPKLRAAIKIILGGIWELS